MQYLIQVKFNCIFCTVPSILFINTHSIGSGEEESLKIAKEICVFHILAFRKDFFNPFSSNETLEIC